jgi:hypothetical protein
VFAGGDPRSRSLYEETETKVKVYKRCFPNKFIFDLSQNPESGYGRGDQSPPKGQRHHWEAVFSKINWPQMALGIGLLRSSALQNDGHIIRHFAMPNSSVDPS